MIILLLVVFCKLYFTESIGDQILNASIKVLSSDFGILVASEDVLIFRELFELGEDFDDRLSTLLSLQVEF